MSTPAVNSSPLKPPIPAGQQQRLNWGRLHGCAKSLAIASAVKEHPGFFVIITADQISASRFSEELRFFISQGNADNIFLFPDWETLPYDHCSPYQDIISERLSVLMALQTISKGMLIVPVSTLMHRLLPKDYLLSHSLFLQTGQQLNPVAFREEMDSVGYRFVSQVMEHGDIAIRGAILDIFPMGAVVPYRIELFDDDIDSIRTFDIESQRSREKVAQIRILPAREVPLTPEGIAHFRSSWRSRFEGNPNKHPVYMAVSEGIAPAGIEYFMPLFYSQTNALLDYLPRGATLIVDEGVDDAAKAYWEVINMRYEQGRDDAMRPVLAPDELFYRPQELSRRLTPFTQIHTHKTRLDPDKNSNTNFATKNPISIPIDARARDPFALFRGFMDAYQGKVLIIAASIGRSETIMALFGEQGFRPVRCEGWDAFITRDLAFALTVATLEEGAALEQPDLLILSESQLFGERAQQRRRRKRQKQHTEAIVRDLTELTMGAPVVHEEHGVGRYAGLVILTVNDVLSEFICLEYDQGDKLYVPVTSLDLISRFTGIDPEQAPLHRLGSGQWLKAKRKALECVYDVAAELLELHARRAARHGSIFTLDNNAYAAFIQDFPFEETPGQMDAINDVLADMQDPKPMDRLICGDSGFGKTEVAMRAAFIAVQNNKQVALLVPTTLLAQQHYQNFKDRFANWPVRIEVLSRFVSKKEQQAVSEDIVDGRADIIIGTHKLLQDDLHFKSMGLVIIDEEHRFGVRQKEKLRSLRAEVDVLTLTATPIPRTLHFALSDLRSLSIIATPPSKRLPITTFIREWHTPTLKEALLREIKRGGQVYFVHNEIKTIERMAAQVEDLIPQAKVQIAHGQLPERSLEQVMLDFYHLRFNVLLCTTIIETGIDVPSANTIIINRADKFGLAQLYQLRGRVGRSHHRAYAYLITPHKSAMSKDAVKRLEAIASLEDLGIGFTLATHDLEIRGAGEMLGDAQSGQIQEIGFGMYMSLLERAVHSLKAGKQPQLDRPLGHGAEIDLHIPALIPADYLADVHARLIMYKRIASSQDSSELADLQEECIDRFGLLPQQLKNLFRLTEMKLKAQPLGIRRIDMGERGGRIYFHSSTIIDPGKIIELVQSRPDLYRLDGGDKLAIMGKFEDVQERLYLLDGLLAQLSMKAAA